MKLLAKNKKGLFSYELIQRFEAGLVLSGWEVKSIKAGNVSLKESYIIGKDSELWLVSCHVGRWPGMQGYKEGIEVQPRKILLHDYEMRKLHMASKAKGMAIIPIDIFLQRGRVKMTVALARGKQLHDKRAKIKERDAKREIAKDVGRKV